MPITYKPGGEVQRPPITEIDSQVQGLLGQAIARLRDILQLKVSTSPESTEAKNTDDTTSAIDNQ